MGGDTKAASPAAPPVATNPGAYDADEHLLPVADVAARYGTHVDEAHPDNSRGLAEADVPGLQAKWGRNALTPPKQTPEILKLLLQFTNPLLMMLMLACVLTFLVYGIQQPRDIENLILASVMAFVILVLAFTSYWQERSAGNVMASLKKMMPSQCTVVRDGAEERVDAAELVPGDLVRLAIGDRIPADARVVQSYGLKVECSSLTGESDLIPATIDRASDEALEARNIVFAGSLVMQGSGRVVVVRTGDRTMIGRIAALASAGQAGGSGGGNKKPSKTTLQIEIDRLIVFVGIVAAVVPVALFAIGAARERLNPLQAFVNGFVLAVVACVLQGMRATVLSLLALCSTRLRERNVLIKRTDTIENLGCATIICSDKTGTLTQNVMTVQSVWVGGAGAERHPADGAVAALGGGGAGGGGAGNGGATPAAGPAADKAGGTLAALAAQPVSSLQPGASPFAWELSSTLAKLVVVATVCNKAQFAGAETAAAGGKSDDGNSTNNNNGTVAVHIATPVPAADPKEPPQLLGDATDCGLLRFADRSMPTAQVRAAYKKIYERPFNSTDKFSLAVAALPPAGGAESASGGGKKPSSSSSSSQQPRYILFLKGAPEIVVAKCGRYCAATTGEETAIDASFHDEFTAAYESAGGSGERVIGFSYAPLELPLSALAAAAAMSNPADAAEVLREAASEAVDALVTAKALTFMGLISLMDPPRDGVKNAVQTCREAGIRVAMVTGDHPLTAEAIARKVGIITLPVVRGTEVAALHRRADGPAQRVMALSKRNVGSGSGLIGKTLARFGSGDASDASLSPKKKNKKDPATLSPLAHHTPSVVAKHASTALVVTGSELRELDALAADGRISPAEHEARWDGLLAKREIVFARTSPEQKLQIVARLQEHLGEVVAVTGDGVNDAPALKCASIGVAMGKGGSDVARDASDIILLDDNFASVVGACEEGRVVFDNLKKTIAYTVAHVLPELLPLFLSVALNMPLGMGGLLILSIDLITEQGPAISLAYEPGEDATMKRPPRNRAKERLIGARLLTYGYLIVGGVMAAACLAAYFIAFLVNGVPIWAIWDRGATYWKEGAAPLEICDTGKACRTLDGREQYRIVREAHAAWYVTLILSQGFHIFCCKTRTVSIFKHGIFRNRTTVYGLMVSFTVAAILVFVPKVNDLFSAAPPPGLCWIPFAVFGVWVVCYTEWTKSCARKNPNGWVAKHLAW